MKQRFGDEAGEQPSPIPDDTPDVLLTAVAAMETSTPPAGSGWSRRELLTIVVAVLFGGSVTFALLRDRGVAGPEAVAAHVATPAKATAPSSPIVPSGGANAKWSTANVDRWVGNGRRKFAAELPAENRVAIWQRQVRPVLVVRCLAQGLEVFVFTDSAAKIEPRTEDHTVRITLDDGPEATERWPDSADHDALFAPDGAALTRQLVGARTLRFVYTPHNASPVVAHFNIAGLDAALAPAAKQCGK